MYISVVGECWLSDLAGIPFSVEGLATENPLLPAAVNEARGKKKNCLLSHSLQPTSLPPSDHPSVRIQDSILAAPLATARETSGVCHIHTYAFHHPNRFNRTHLFQPNH